MSDPCALPVSPAAGPAGLPSVDATLLGDRVGRLAAGATLIVGAVATAAVSLVDGGSPRAALLVAWGAAGLALLIGRAIGRRQRVDPGLVRRGLVLPVIGISLTAPLGMHALLSFFVGASADEFRDWVLLSFALTAQSHLVLASLATVAALRHLEGREAPSTLQVLGACVLSATVPIGTLAIGDLGDIGDILALAVLTVAVQIAVLGPIFMVPMLRMARSAARRERTVMA